MFKQVIIVRRDLKWGKGKLAAHVAHASLGSIKGIENKVLEKWEGKGGKKVVLKIDELKELEKIHKKVKKTNLPHFLVRDSGLTQLKAGTVTCLGIGPAEEKEIDKITGKLKLL